MHVDLDVDLAVGTKPPLGQEWTEVEMLEEEGDSSVLFIPHVLVKFRRKLNAVDLVRALGETQWGRKWGEFVFLTNQ